MYKVKWWIFTVVFITTVTACGNLGDHQEHDVKEVSVKPLEVDLQGSDHLRKNETGHFEAIVTQGNEQVNDADEVEFEIWKDGSKKESIMLEAKNEGKGVYSVEYAFEEEGEYVVQSHVTARDMHTMPTKKVIVNN
ncbi:FixH family protein [Pseudalkalibacillus salsuginis]|uniref:FixH family protein n=1 Tax=Pseudalkalibacillus salsuginis TaxID=2910972 RepID=UPI001F386C30|nr:FixH family protein [Pseudalkalibacillus salsuginis]MCF6409431.1 FixH family protein [Pseudalkalibacillus salsuginis]